MNTGEGKKKKQSCKPYPYICFGCYEDPLNPQKTGKKCNSESAGFQFVAVSLTFLFIFPPRNDRTRTAW